MKAVEGVLARTLTIYILFEIYRLLELKLWNLKVI